MGVLVVGVAAAAALVVELVLAEAGEWFWL